MMSSVITSACMGFVKSDISFFFFQAEDGVRDKLVTGFQTCALPISIALGRIIVVCVPPRPCSVTIIGAFWSFLTFDDTNSAYGMSSFVSAKWCVRIWTRESTRSEERRVGKECRLWWSLDYRRARTVR